MGKVLVSWVGNADISGLSNTANGSKGPLDAILCADNYDHIYLLHNQPQSTVKPLIEALKQRCSNGGDSVHAHKVKLSSPIHFGDIYTALDSVLKIAVSANPNYQLYIQLTSGTSTMTAVSILVGKTKYPARFIQSSIEQGVKEELIPFDVAADFLPALAEHNDTQLTQLMNGDAPITAAFDDILTRNTDMLRLKQLAAILAGRDVPVLITGESGTGKELFATAIVNASQRKHKPFLTLNCGAIPPDLIDATLFGHTKGAFTGATEARKGYFEQCDGGTLFLDEFGELPLTHQVRLLRVLQDGTFTPVGSTKEQKVNVRLITATNKNLIDEIAAGRFREDLFYRVAIGILHLPPLRNRKEDIVVLAESLLEKINVEAATQPYLHKGNKHKKLSVKAKNLIKLYPWPGNVRELNATLLRASLWGAGESISDTDIQQASFQRPTQDSDMLNQDISQGVDIQGVIAKVSKLYIHKALEESSGSKTKAAELLGLKNYQTLNNWIEKYNIK